MRLLSLLSVGWAIVYLGLVAAPLPAQPQAGAAMELARLITSFSEEGGSFPSENLISNELAYPHALEGLRPLQVQGGTYLGVGPEQNFTYIAAVRPEWAFIVDIRRENTLQHLLYKALFARAEDRREFLSLLLSRPGQGEPPSLAGRAAEATVADLVASLDSLQPNLETCERNLQEMCAWIENQVGFPLSERDRSALRSIYRAFAQAGLDVQYTFPNHPRSSYPTLRDLLLAKDSQGRYQHFLAREEDFQFVKRLHEQNRIVPVTGDFAGPQALRQVGAFVREQGSFVSAFYLSNVEQYLNGAQYVAFVENVRRLPLTEQSRLIRCFFGEAQKQPGPGPTGFWPHTFVIQRAQKFLQLYDEGAYWKHQDLIRREYVEWSGGVME